MLLVDALMLCLLRGDNGINFLSPEPFRKAEHEPMRDKLRVCLKGPWRVCRDLALLTARCGLWAHSPSPPCILIWGGGGGREGDFREDPGASSLLGTSQGGCWGRLSTLSSCFIASHPLLPWECVTDLCIHYGLSPSIECQDFVFVLQPSGAE